MRSEISILGVEKEEIISKIMDFISIKTFIAIIILYFIIVWIAIIVWVIKDISNRTNSIILQIISTFIVIIFGPLGILIYLLIRPSRTFYEKYYEEVEGNIDFLTEAIFKKLEKKEKEISKKDKSEKKDKTKKKKK